MVRCLSIRNLIKYPKIKMVRRKEVKQEKPRRQYTLHSRSVEGFGLCAQLTTTFHVPCESKSSTEPKQNQEPHQNPICWHWRSLHHGHKGLRKLSFDAGQSKHEIISSEQRCKPTHSVEHRKSKCRMTLLLVKFANETLSKKFKQLV